MSNFQQSSPVKTGGKQSPTPTGVRTEEEAPISSGWSQLSTNAVVAQAMLLLQKIMDLKQSLAEQEMELASDRYGVEGNTGDFIGKAIQAGAEADAKSIQAESISNLVSGVTSLSLAACGAAMTVSKRINNNRLKKEQTDLRSYQNQLKDHPESAPQISDNPPEGTKAHLNRLKNRTWSPENGGETVAQRTKALKALNQRGLNSAEKEEALKVTDDRRLELDKLMEENNQSVQGILNIFNITTSGMSETARGATGMVREAQTLEKGLQDSLNRVAQNAVDMLKSWSPYQQASDEFKNALEILATLQAMQSFMEYKPS